MQQDEYYSYFFPKFKSLGYYCLFKKRTGDKPDGCCLIFKVSYFSRSLVLFFHFFFFKKRKFNLISYEFIDYFTQNIESLDK